jgi:hypothetical protein
LLEYDQYIKDFYKIKRENSEYAQGIEEAIAKP